MSEDIRILCVDDEENILKAIQRGLRKKFDIATATSGKEALRMLEEEGPFPVVISDMRMPQMDGAEFLGRVRDRFPETVRLLLTGYAELETVVAAVNRGNIFRFIAKPCTAGELYEAIRDAVRQYELISSERVLLEQTLKGSIHALTEVLSMSNPAAFGRGSRIRQLAALLAADLGVADPWQVEVAAMLSPIGSITLPEATVMKVYQGDTLSNEELAMVARMPEMTRNVLGGIPRLESVIEILDYQTKNFDGTGIPEGPLVGEEIPLGARVLKVCSLCEELQNQGESPGRIIDRLKATKGAFDPAVVAAFERLAAKEDGKETARGVSLQDLRTGMVFTEEVKSKTGILLVAAGQEVTISLLERIQNYEKTIGLKVPMWVLNPEAGPDEEPGADPIGEWVGELERETVVETGE